MARVLITATPTALAPKPVAGTKYLLQNTGSEAVHLIEAATAPKVTDGGYRLMPGMPWTITGGTLDFWVWAAGSSSLEYGGA